MGDVFDEEDPRYQDYGQEGMFADEEGEMDDLNQYEEEEMLDPEEQ